MPDRYSGVARPEGVGETDQLINENRYLGKIATFAGAGSDGAATTAQRPGTIRAEVEI